MKIYRSLWKNAKMVVEERIDHFSKFNPSPLSMLQFTEFGKKASNAESYSFLGKELPVRLANIMKEINLLPDVLLKTPSLIEVKDLYVQSFVDLIEFEGKKKLDSAGLDKFTEALITIRNRHKDIVMMTAQGVMELKESNEMTANVEQNVQYFLDRFYMTRVSIRMLINQHTLLFGGSPNSHDHIGCIDPNCDVIRVIEDAYENARFLCDQYYMASPELIIKHHNDHTKATSIAKQEGKQATMHPVRVAYVPSHLYHMLFELIKNSMRAVVEHHGSNNDKYPPLEIMVVMGTEDLTIKVCDQGGGIARSQMGDLFNYVYSTAPQPITSGDIPPLAGYGYGLPLSRLYARYFHGDLVLNSVEGYGTDASIFLKAISSEASELLPIYNKTCQRQYATPVQTSDWSSSTMFVRPYSTTTVKVRK